MSTPEFSRPVPLDRLGRKPQSMRLEADADERAGLAARFGLIALDLLVAEVTLARTATGAELSGRLEARVVQACALSGEPVPARLDAPVEVRFEPAPDAEELELEPDDLDVVPIASGAVDPAEAVAQTLALALDPYPRAAEAALAAVRRHIVSEAEVAAQQAADRAAANPFAALGRKGDPA